MDGEECEMEASGSSTIVPPSTYNIPHQPSSSLSDLPQLKTGPHRLVGVQSRKFSIYFRHRPACLSPINLIFYKFSFPTAIGCRSLPSPAVVTRGTRVMLGWWRAPHPSILICSKPYHLMQWDNTSDMYGSQSLAVMLQRCLLKGG